MTLIIRSFKHKVDDQKVYNLWQENFGKTWPLDLSTFIKIISLGDHFVAINNEKITGFIATQTLGDRASILTLLGYDQDILNYAVKFLKSKNVRQIQLGNGGSSYFWPGIPTNLPKLIKFFEDNGWKFTEDSFDLVINTTDFRVMRHDIEIKTANANKVQEILQFEEKHFPEWLGAYQRKVELKDFNDIFYVEDGGKNIIGTVFIFSAESKSAKEHQIWKQLLGEDMGGICCLGVRKDKRQKGIGLALVAQATQVLKERKASNIFVGYTWLVDWYGKLGYKVWRQYKMSWKQL